MKYHFTYDCVKENLYHIEVKKQGGPLFKNIALESRLLQYIDALNSTLLKQKAGE